jgi:hypothetical protein
MTWPCAWARASGCGAGLRVCHVVPLKSCGLRSTSVTRGSSLLIALMFARSSFSVQVQRRGPAAGGGTPGARAVPGLPPFRDRGPHPGVLPRPAKPHLFRSLVVGSIVATALITPMGRGCLTQAPVRRGTAESDTGTRSVPEKLSSRPTSRLPARPRSSFRRGSAFSSRPSPDAAQYARRWLSRRLSVSTGSSRG